MNRLLDQEAVQEILEKARAIGARSDLDRLGKLHAWCRLLHDEVEHYQWVGFYIAEPERRELRLDAYVGDPTDHVRIAYGKGICGQAAETLKTFVVQDVAEESNYLSCSLHVKSEVVVPLFHKGCFVGELDIDSHFVAPFTEWDSRLLEAIAYLAGPVAQA